MSDDPFYDLIPTTTTTTMSPNETSEEIYDELVEYWANFSMFNDQPCPLQFSRLSFTWIMVTTVPSYFNGMPIRPIPAASSDPPVIVLFCVAGTIEALFNGYTMWVIAKSPTLSRPVKYYIIMDLLVKFLFALNRFNRVLCILTWYCVSTDGYPFSWLMLNNITSGIEFGLDLTSKFVAFAFGVNRFFALFFDGKYYRPVERSVIPQIFLMTVFPVAGYLLSIGKLVNKETGYVCYGGTFFNPANYLFTWFYSWKAAFTNTWEIAAETYMTPILGALALVVDSLTLWKLRQLNKKPISNISKQKRKGEQKLLIMIFGTHVITMIRFLQNKFLRIDVKSDYEHTILRQFYYLTIPIMIFRFLQTLCILLFNLPPRKSKSPSTSEFSKVTASVIRVESQR